MILSLFPIKFTFNHSSPILLTGEELDFYNSTCQSIIESKIPETILIKNGPVERPVDFFTIPIPEVKLQRNVTLLREKLVTTLEKTYAIIKEGQCVGKDIIILIDIQNLQREYSLVHLFAEIQRILRSAIEDSS